MNSAFQELFDSLHIMEIKVLRAFLEYDALTTNELTELTGLQPAQLRRALEWLLSKQALSVVAEKVIPLVSLTTRGQYFAQNQIPEARILQRLREGKCTMKQLQQMPGLEKKEISTAVGILKKMSAIKIVAGGEVQLDEAADTSAIEQRQAFIQQLHQENTMELEALSSQQQEWVNNFRESRGKAGIFKLSNKVLRTLQLSELGTQLRDACVAEGKTGDELTHLTPEMLQDGSWRGKQFSKYYLKFKPKRTVVGKHHPYRQFLDFVKRKLIALGFSEMRGTLVENEFWNMDALYMPQFHSARDIHDVYFVKDPTHAREIPEPFFSQVAQAHENGGGSGSRGWGYKFDRERTRRLILRSQGTALSARTLASRPQIPGKYFAIARCFRYDQVDATHAADFFQVEGIVLGEEINFRHLLGLLKLFALEVARSKEVKFIPSYFPFTEPSVEAHMKHPQLGWMELGGAGIFRPELTHALGVEVPVIAWGLGLDRMAMVALGIHDIRDLFSYDLDLVRSKCFISL